MATNRADTLDPALLRPGRLDRKIEFPIPDRRQKRLIFSTITSKMNVSEEVDLEDYVARPDKISGADINAICQEVRHKEVYSYQEWGHRLSKYGTLSTEECLKDHIITYLSVFPMNILSLQTFEFLICY